MRTHNIHLTRHQKSILATIAQGGPKGIADDTLASSVNLQGAFKQLVKLGMIENSERDLYVMTEKGLQFATDENIIDDTGTITDQGQGFVIGNMKESITFKDYLMLT